MASPAATAAAPVMVVVATEPRLPISHAPVRRGCIRLLPLNAPEPPTLASLSTKVIDAIRRK